MSVEIEIEIFHHRHATYEEWLYVENGAIFYHYENDGPRVLRKGIEPHDETLSFGEAVKRFPNYEGAIHAAIQTQTSSGAPRE